MIKSIFLSDFEHDKSDSVQFQNPSQTCTKCLRGFSSCNGRAKSTMWKLAKREGSLNGGSWEEREIKKKTSRN